MALEIEPGNRAIREQLDATRKLIRRIEFEKVGPGRHRGGESRRRDEVARCGLIWLGTAGSSHIDTIVGNRSLARRLDLVVLLCSSLVCRPGSPAT
jgi:hypothetical protein